MKKIFALALALLMLIALAACGETTKSETNTTPTETVTAIGDVVTGVIPSGWSFISGTDMNGADGADFICHAKEYKLGDAYLQAAVYNSGIDDAKAVLESADPYGAYVDEVELPNGTWYIAENAAASLIGDKAMLVKGYQCDFSSNEVQSILGSLNWAK